MMLRSLILLVMTASLAAADSGTEPVRSEAQLSGPGMLLGRWKVLSFVSGGKNQELPVKQMEVTHEHLRFAGGPMNGLMVKYKTPSATPPWTIDLRDGSDPYLGIFEIQGRVLKMCWDDDHGKRPGEIKSPKGTKWAILILRRAN